jgi:hypothetical protein
MSFLDSATVEPTYASPGVAPGRARKEISVNMKEVKDENKLNL